MEKIGLSQITESTTQQVDKGVPSKLKEQALKVGTVTKNPSGAVHPASSKGLKETSPLKTLEPAEAVQNIRQEKMNRKLMKAIGKGDFDKCQELIEAGADVNCQIEGETPLLKATKNDSYKICKLLIENGAKVNKRDENKNAPLHFATNPKICQLLIDNGAKVNAKNEKGFTPLHMAVTEGEKKICKILIANEADIEAKDNEGFTPFAQAIFVLSEENETSEKIAGLLVDAGADINTKDDQGNTPLHLAALRFPAKVQFLLDHGAKVNRQNDAGNTPLHIAVGNKNEGICKMLLNEGARIDIANKEGFSPLYRSNLLQVALKVNKGVFQAALQQRETQYLEQQEYDKELRLRKYLAHGFALAGETKMKKGGQEHTFELEGAHAPYFWRKFHNGLARAAQAVKSDTRKDLKTIDKACQSASQNLTSEELYEKWQQGEPVIINTGHQGHHISVALWGDQLVICNRGEGTLPGQPVEGKTYAVFNIDRSQLSAEVIENLMKQAKTATRDESDANFVNLVQDLGGEEIILDDLKVREQKVGNCSFENSEGMVFPLLVLARCKRQGIEISPENADEVNGVVKKQRPLYESWKINGQLHLVDRYISRCNLIPVEDLSPENRARDMGLLQDAILSGYRDAVASNIPGAVELWQEKIQDYNRLARKFNEYTESEEISPIDIGQKSDEAHWDEIEVMLHSLQDVTVRQIAENGRVTEVKLKRALNRTLQVIKTTDPADPARKTAVRQYKRLYEAAMEKKVALTPAHAKAYDLAKDEIYTDLYSSDDKKALLARMGNAFDALTFDLTPEGIAKMNEFKFLYECAKEDKYTEAVTQYENVYNLIGERLEKASLTGRVEPLKN